MTWEEQLFDLFEDLEQRAEGLALAERDAEVAELARAEYAEVELASRLHASVGTDVELRLTAVGPLRGRLVGVGQGWCLVTRADGARGEEWVVLTGRVLGYRGLHRGARTEALRPLTARLGIGSVLRRLIEHPLVVVTVDGERRSGAVARVGADFLELSGDRGVEVVPFDGVVALRAV